MRKRRIYKAYGLSFDEYLNLIQSQNNTCKICKAAFKRTKDIHVDHNHNTGKIRGILCSNCNRCLGLLKDNITVLQNAIEYLSKEEQFYAN